MNEDGTVNRKNVKRKGIEIVNSIAAGGGEGMDKLLQAAADSGAVSSTALPSQRMTVSPGFARITRAR